MSVRNFWVYMLMTVLLGCGKESSRHSSLSSEAEGIKDEIKKIGECMTSSGITVGEMGDALARRVRRSPKTDRIQIASFFMQSLAGLCVQEVSMDKCPVWLFNCQELLKSTSLYMEDLEDKEWPVRLHFLCVRRYEQTLRLCSEQRNKASNTRSQRQLDNVRITLKSDFKLFSEMIRKVFLPLVVERNLPRERFLFWKVQFNEVLGNSD